MKPQPERPDWLYQISYGLAEGSKLRILLENDRYAVVQTPGGRWWDNSGGHYGGASYSLVDKQRLHTYRKSVGLMDCMEIQQGGRPKLAQWKKLIEEGPKMTKFRWHRGGYAESMATVVPASTLDDLKKIYEGSELKEPGDATLTVEPYNGTDRRNNWNTHIVKVNGSPIGFTDGMPSEPEPVAAPCKGGNGRSCSQDATDCCSMCGKDICPDHIGAEQPDDPTAIVCTDCD